MQNAPAPETKHGKKKSEKTNKTRMSPEEREELIVKEAIHFFAEQGLEGKTRDLAKRIGITQPLLYRYFPSKEHLIERVYQEVYIGRWDSKWEELIADRTQSLENRLCRFYKEYARAVYDYSWVRIFVHSGLKGEGINERYLKIIREKVLWPIVTELRHTNNLADPHTLPISEDEIELVWGLHGAFFYRAIRHFAYNMPMTDDPDKAIDNDVRIFLGGVPNIQKKIVQAAQENT